jgi:hypothetical protein
LDTNSPDYLIKQQEKVFHLLLTSISLQNGNLFAPYYRDFITKFKKKGWFCQPVFKFTMI